MKNHPPFPLQLFISLLRESPAQPATNLWRAHELTVLMNHALPRLRDGQNILDLGCGDGGVMALLKPRLSPDAKITGLDADAEETALAKTRGVYAEVLSSGAEKMPIADASMDAIVSNSVLEHIDPLDAVLGEAGRVLRSGGWFVATVPGPDFHRLLRGPWLPWISRAAYEHALDERLAHRRYWSGEEWRQHMAAARLDLVEAIPYLPKDILRRWEFFSRLTGGLLYHLGGKKRAPIQLQRALGVRRRVPLLSFAMPGLARLFSCGLSREAKGPYGGLLILGRKT